MTSASTLSALAERIAANTAAITSFCEINGYPSRSLRDRQSPPSLLPSDAPEEIRVKQQELLDLALELQLLTTDVNQYMARQIAQHHQFYCLRWLFHFKIPSLVPLDSPISYSELATKAHVPASQLTSIARMAILINFFREPEPGNLAHNWVSAGFVETPSLSELGQFLTSLSAPLATKMVEATEQWGATEAINETAYNIANNTDLVIFKHIASVPELREDYARYMKNQASTEGISLSHLVRGFDWASLGAATVADIGGSTGHASAALAVQFPHLKFIVQDLPGTIQNARSTCAFPPSVRERITFQEQDFFTPQSSSQEVDVFLLRMILHDWRDPDAIKILRNLLDASARQAKAVSIIVMDIVMPESGGRSDSSIPRTQQMDLRVRDLTMLQAHGARERDLQDWKQLFTAADPRLTLRNVVRPFKSMMSVMELGVEQTS